MKTIFDLACWILLLFILTFISLNVHADMLRVGVIDTGINTRDPRISAHLCTDGVKDFTGTTTEDTMGHGTAVVGLIEEYAKDSNYCLKMYKYWTIRKALSPYLKALKRAIEDKMDIINMSLGGDTVSDEERYLICQKGKDLSFIVAAGNSGKSLIDSPLYPASYDCPNINVVGGLNYPLSNYGPMVKFFEDASEVKVIVPYGTTTMSGTSMATAIETGKLIYEKSHEKSSTHATH